MPQRSVGSIIGNQGPVSAGGELTVEQAARLMKEKRVGALLVMEGDRLAGIFTERDALFRVLAEGRDPARTSLQEVMTANPRTIGPERPFGHALHMMHEGGFRHVPVVQGHRAIGVVSARDALGPELEAFVFELDKREHIFEVLG
jgi:CBS domain-containing protein